jgi:adenosylmethionine-8-amino-7-oxononanoate aminotransferase
MCGMGRTGYLHAWQKSGVAPDIQLVGKGLGSGAAEISGMLVGEKIAQAFARSGEPFAHGHTFRNSPLNAAVALTTLRIIESDGLVENVRKLGLVLEKRLKERLGNHRYVGEIRGIGFFWSVRLLHLSFLRVD